MCGAGAERAQCKGADAQHEHPLAREEVGDAATEEKEATKGEGVGRDRPLQIGSVEVQFTFDGGVCHGHDGDIDSENELGHAKCGQQQIVPAPTEIGGAGGRRRRA